MEELTLKCEVRGELGRAATNRLRSEGFLPVNVYGHKRENRHLAVEYRAFDRFIRGGHRVVSLSVDGAEEHGVVREIQWDGLGSTMLHVDVTRVDLQETIEMSVPIHTIGVAKGQSAGTLDMPLHEVTVSGPARAIPEKFEIKIAALDVGEAIRVKDLEVPARCTIVNDPEDVVIAVHEQQEEAEPGEGEQAAEPEVIGRKKEDEESE